MRELTSAGSVAFCVCTAPTGREIAYASGSAIRRLGQAEDSEVVTADEAVTCLCERALESWIFAGESGKLYEYSSTTGTIAVIYESRHRIGEITCFGHMILLATSGLRPILLLGSEEKALECSFSSGVQQVSFSPTGKFLCCSDSQGKIALFRFGTWELISQFCTWTGLKAPPLRFVWSENNDWVALPGDFRVKTLDCETMDAQPSPLAFRERVSGLAWMKAGALLAVVTEKLAVFLWEVERGLVVGCVALQSVHTFIALDGVFAYSDDSIHILLRSDFHMSTARTEMDRSETPLEDTLGVVLQAPKEHFSASEKETVLFRSLQGSIVRGKKVSEVGGESLEFFSVDVTFARSDFHKNLHIIDTSDIHIAHMSESGAVFASKRKGELGEDDFVEEDKLNRKARVLFKSFSGGSDWTLKLPGNEDVLTVACANSYCALVTSTLRLRVVSTLGGVQLASVSLSAPVAALATFKDVLAILSHCAVPLSSQQRLSVAIYDISPTLGIRQRQSCVTLSDSVFWFGFTSDGHIAYSNSCGVVKVMDQGLKAWEIVAEVPSWRVVGLSKSEVFGVAPGDVRPGLNPALSFLSRKSFSLPARPPLVPSSELSAALLLPEPDEALTDKFLELLIQNVSEGNTAKICRLISHLRKDSDKTKCVAMLLKLYPEVGKAVKATLDPLILKRKQERLESAGKRAKVAESR